VAKVRNSSSGTKSSGLRVRVTQKRSVAGRDARFKRVMDSIGLARIGDSVELPANPSILGTLKKVSHVVEIQELS